MSMSRPITARISAWVRSSKIRAVAWPRPADILPVLPKQSSFAHIGSPARHRRGGRRNARSDQEHVQGTFLCAAHGRAKLENSGACRSSFRKRRLLRSARRQTRYALHYSDGFPRFGKKYARVLPRHSRGCAGRFACHARTVADAGVCGAGRYGGRSVHARLFDRAVS